MKIIRYQDSAGRVGHASQQNDEAARVIEGDIFGDWTVTDAKADVQKLLAPVEPTVVIGIGLNYRGHAAETGAVIPEDPVMFIKMPGTLQHPGDPIVIPNVCDREEVDYECELAVVIGRACTNVGRDDALSCVLGYTWANDVSARNWQKKRGGGQFCRGKGFDTFLPLGPCLVTTDEIEDPDNLAIKTTVNGDVRQDGNTNDMIHDVAALIEFLSQDTTLAAGTVILTGTPQGVGAARKPPVWLCAGDTVVVEVEGIGVLSNPVVGP